jgi:very-short-patch-repair endonuclease
MAPPNRQILRTISALAEQQHATFATWQLIERDFSRGEVSAAVKRHERVYRGVYATDELTPLGRFMAASLAAGRGSGVAADSALQLLEMRPHKEGAIHLVAPRPGGRSQREALLIRRPERLDLITHHGIPVTTPSRSLLDAARDLRPHELYRAIEQAHRRNLRIDTQELTKSPILKDVLQLFNQVAGRTRSDAEAAFLFVCKDNRLALPRVNHRLNRFETDFHWPGPRVVLEVDGFEHHKEKPQFEEDRRRGLKHRAAGYEVIRASADCVYDRPHTIVEALLSAAPSLATTR